jgi:hypothetical protein
MPPRPACAASSDAARLERTTMTSAPIDDLTLHAWLDGELPPERHAEV